MKFTPKSYNQLVNDLLLQKGEADYEIIAYTEKKSKDTNRPMAEFVFRAKDISGRTGKIKHYIMLDEDADVIMKKYRDICYSAGKAHLYEAGDVDEKIVGGRGRFILGISPGNNGYPDKNSIILFIVPKDDQATNVQTNNSNEINMEEAPPFDDDIPFN